MTVRTSDGDGAKSFHHYDPKFPNMKEVVLVAAGEIIPPDEWGYRTVPFLDKELTPMKGSWPVEWEGNMAVRIVTKLEDI